MIVTVNGQTMDLALENERTVAELLAPLSRWLEDGGMSIASFSLDGMPVEDGAFDAACERELSGIDRFDAIAHSRIELLREALGEGERALSDFLTKDDGRRTALREWQERPAANFLARSEAELAALMAEAMDLTAAEVSGSPASKAEAALVILRERSREADSPRVELAAVGSVLEPLASRLEELPLELQTGKDAKAAETLRDLAVMAEKLLRIVPLLRYDGLDIHAIQVGAVDFRSFVEELDAALRELVAAFESGDAVLVGDLSEYEIAPRMRSLAAALSALTAA